MNFDMPMMNEKNLIYPRYWLIGGGIVAFFVLNFIAGFVPFYTYTTELELLSRWSLIIFGMFLGATISFSQHRRQFLKFVLMGAVGFWFAREAVSFAVGYYDAWIQPIDLPYPWVDILVLAMIGAMGGMLLGYRMNGWRGMLFLMLVVAAGMGLANAVTLNLTNQVGLNPQHYSFFTPRNLGVVAWLLNTLIGSLVWTCAWIFCPKSLLETPPNDYNQ